MTNTRMQNISNYESPILLLSVGVNNLISNSYDGNSLYRENLKQHHLLHRNIQGEVFKNPLLGFRRTRKAVTRMEASSDREVSSLFKS